MAILLSSNGSPLFPCVLLWFKLAIMVSDKSAKLSYNHSMDQQDKIVKGLYIDFFGKEGMQLTV